MAVEEKLVKLDAWRTLVDNSAPLVEYIDFKINRYRIEIKQLEKNPSLDTSFKVTALSSKIAELEEIKRELQHQKQQHKQEALNARQAGHSESSTQDS